MFQRSIASISSLDSPLSTVLRMQGSTASVAVRWSVSKIPRSRTTSRADLLNGSTVKLSASFVRPIGFIKACVGEFRAYRELCEETNASALMEPSDLCDWWARYGHLIPSLELLARDLASMCPSSAAAESVFSILRQMFTPQQRSALEETVEGSTMLHHNSRNAKWPVSE